MESVIFKLSADSTNVATGLNKSRAMIEAHVAKQTALMKKAAAEQFVTDKAGYNNQLKLVKQFESAKTQELLAASRKRDAIRAESARREQYLIDRETDRVRGAERAKTIAIERRANAAVIAAKMQGPDLSGRQFRQWQAGAANREIAAGSGGTAWVGKTSGKGTNQAGAGYSSGGMGGSMVGAQVAGDIASGASSGDLVKGVGGALTVVGGSIIGGSAGNWLQEKAMSKLKKQFISNLIKRFGKWALAAAGTAAGGAGLIGASGVGGWLAGTWIRKKYVDPAMEGGQAESVKNSADTYGKVGSSLSQMVMNAHAQGKISDSQATKMMQTLERRQFAGIKSVQRDLGRVGVQSAAERRAEELKAQLGDQGKGTLDDLAAQGRRFTGTPHRRNYTLTARMKGALKIQDLEEQARVAWEKGDDAGMKKYQEQANELRSAKWMNLRENDKNPQQKILSQLEIIAARLAPVQVMAESVNSENSR